jgi:hypothetical protein
MAQVNMPQQKSQLDDVAKALSIAGSLYGLYADNRRLESARQADQVKAEKEARVAKGELMPEEYNSLIAKDFAPTPEGKTPEAFYTIIDPETGAKRRQGVTARATLLSENTTLQREEDRKSRESIAEESRKSREAIAEESRKMREAYLASQKIKDANMPTEIKTQVTKLATSNADKISIANQIAASLEEFQKAPTEDDRIRIGNGMIKVLNSTQGQDAVGAEESKRLADALNFQKFNLTGPGPMFGRDLPGFESQTLSTLNAIKKSIQSNQEIIEKLKMGSSINIAIPEKKLQKTDGSTALAAPGFKAPAEMTDAEIDEEIARRTGGK